MALRLRVFFLLVLGLISSFATPLRADVALLPQTRHQLFQNFGDFFEIQSQFYNDTGSQAQFNLGEFFPLLRVNDTIQILAFFYIQEFDQVGDKSTFNPLDYNSGGGVAVEWLLNEFARVRLGATHAGAHYSEGTAYNAFFTQSVLENTFNVRFYYDIAKKVRVTLGADPIFRSDPDLQWSITNQAIEYFPYNGWLLKPFIAIGSTQEGVTGYSTDFSFNIKIGLATADPFSELHDMSGRIVGGYYSGPDPDLKNWALTQDLVHFYYLGAEFSF